MKKTNWMRIPLALAVMAIGSTAFGADHLDGPGVSADPAADITDVYSWIDGTNVVLALDVNPLAMSGTKFSDKVQYVLHTESQANFLSATSKAVDIICTFDAAQKISCWIGKEDYVTGDASATSGLKSDSAKFKVFAGLRDDPFFFNLDGFHAVEKDVEMAGMLPADAAGCPNLDVPTANALVNQLKTDAMGGPAKDFFKGLNVLSIVLSVDKSLLTTGGPIMSVWASTNKGS